ncbi:YaaR family protein [Neobacillus sp. MM2021_6]|uniref:YaaR family protein n=1 Tax=Bacillaceae TaxID=186817 RepID=UPI00140CB141|nr:MULTISPECIES: YaaR family protein [Bacillaceae]MBO0962798.1 YaaR family protein [Neobacillus sp. MM2021_6]NHC21079.1 YaaR family protein [Bacillus sp. MM2020_4]
MKIQDPVRVNIGDPRPAGAERSNANQAAFQKIISSYSKDLTKDYLHKLLEDIDQQGQQLSDNPTFRELQKYKDLVKQFMGEVTKNGLALHQTESWDMYGGNKTLKTIQVLDRKLIELTDHVLNQQTSGLTLLERIGEMKGLLLNLYT